MSTVGFGDLVGALTTLKRKCFVIMPFSSVARVTEQEWTSFFENVLRPAVGACGYDCVRSEPLRGNLIDRIVEALSTSEAVIADLTGRKPNVLYELGVRHALRGRAMIIGRNKRDLTALSDLTSYPWYHYNPTTSVGRLQLAERIRAFLKDIEVHPSMPDSPVADYLQRANHHHSSLQWLTLPTGAQQIALQQQVTRCEQAISEIHQGRIPITGGTAGYFRYFLSLIGHKGTPDRTRVFARVLALEARSGYQNFGTGEIFRVLNEAVRGRRLEIEYTVFVSSPTALHEKLATVLLERYRAFATEVRVVFQNGSVPAQDTEHTIALLDDQSSVLTHAWDLDGAILNPVHWINRTDYERFRDQYERIRLHSIAYPLQT